MGLQGIRQDLVSKQQQSQIKGKEISLKEMKKQSLHFSSLISFSPSYPLPCRGRRIDYVAFQVVLVVKNPPANAGNLRDMGLIPRSGSSRGGGNGNPLQYSCLENLVDRGAWWATVHGVAKSWTRLRLLSMHARTSVLFSIESPEPRTVPGTSKHTTFFKWLLFIVIFFTEGVK